MEAKLGNRSNSVPIFRPGDFINSNNNNSISNNNLADGNNSALPSPL